MSTPCKCKTSKHHTNHNDCCGDRKCCDNRFRVRLGGLTNGMAFRLSQLVDCDVKLIIDGELDKIEGRLTLVGTDFVELLVRNKLDKKNIANRHCKKFLTVPFESIKFIES